MSAALTPLLGIFISPATVLALADHGTAGSGQTGHAFSDGHWRPEVSGPTTKKKSLLSVPCITQCRSKHLAGEECLLAAAIHPTPSPDSWKLSRCGEHPQAWELQKLNRPGSDKCFHSSSTFFRLSYGLYNVYIYTYINTYMLFYDPYHNKCLLFSITISTLRHDF